MSYIHRSRRPIPDLALSLVKTRLAHWVFADFFSGALIESLSMNLL